MDSKNLNMLVNICLWSQETIHDKFKKALEDTGRVTESPGEWIYLKTKSPICLVAHLDTVHKDQCSTGDMFLQRKTIQNYGFTIDGQLREDGNKIIENLSSKSGIGGDDRCGVYAIFKTMEKYGTDECPNILFTWNEEVGCRGAHAFCESDKSPALVDGVKMFIEIDRREAYHFVTYNTDNHELCDILKKYFELEKEFGSTSDISHLESKFKIVAFNLASGYYKPHQTDEYIALDELEWTVEKLFEIIDFFDVFTPGSLIFKEKYSYTSNYGSKASVVWDYKKQEWVTPDEFKKSHKSNNNGQYDDYDECDNDYYGYNPYNKNNISNPYASKYSQKEREQAERINGTRSPYFPKNVLSKITEAYDIQTDAVEPVFEDMQIRDIVIIDKFTKDNQKTYTADITYETGGKKDYIIIMNSYGNCYAWNIQKERWAAVTYITAWEGWYFITQKQKPRGKNGVM